MFDLFESGVVVAYKKSFSFKLPLGFAAHLLELGSRPRLASSCALPVRTSNNCLQLARAFSKAVRRGKCEVAIVDRFDEIQSPHQRSVIVRDSLRQSD
jgi:hypothetical protein